MHYTATFSSKGQLTFPSALRRASKIKSGHQVIISPHKTLKNTFTLSVKPQMSLEDAFGALHDPKIKYTPIEKAREIAGKALGKKYAVTRR